MGKPNFFIIGAPKCGTSSVAHWLSEHPNVYITPIKEPRFFDTDLKTRYRMSPREYSLLYKDVEPFHKAAGEATVWYLFSKAAVPTIERVYPFPKYVVMVRNPVEMAYSLHEEMFVHQNECEKDFLSAWHLSDNRRKGDKVRKWVVEPRFLDYKSVCKLGDQLERLFRFVPKERIHLIALDDIKNSPINEYRRLLKFLGVPHDDRNSFPIINSAKQVRYPIFQKPLIVIQKVERAIKGKLGLVPKNSKIVSYLYNVNREHRKRPPIDLSTRKLLQEYFREDVLKLCTLVERDFSYWLE